MTDKTLDSNFRGWREQTWMTARDALIELVEDGHFGTKVRVAVNNDAGTMTFIHEENNQALTLTPTSITRYGTVVGTDALRRYS